LEAIEIPEEKEIKWIDGSSHS